MVNLSLSFFLSFSFSLLLCFCHHHHHHHHCHGPRRQLSHPIPPPSPPRPPLLAHYQVLSSKWKQIEVYGCSRRRHRHRSWATYSYCWRRRRRSAWERTTVFTFRQWLGELYDVFLHFLLYFFSQSLLLFFKFFFPFLVFLEFLTISSSSLILIVSLLMSLFCKLVSFYLHLFLSFSFCTHFQLSLFLLCLCLWRGKEGRSGWCVDWVSGSVASARSGQVRSGQGFRISKQVSISSALVC